MVRAQAVREEIARGEAFEINLAHVIRTPWEAGGWDLFERLVATAPGDHSAYIDLGGIEIASISPELFLRIVDDRVETRPIKGTRPRGATPAADEARAAEAPALGEGPGRERDDRRPPAQRPHAHRAPLHRPRRGAVHARAHGERHMHLVSAVVAQVLPDVRAPDVVVSCFPGGSITGAPKRRAMELIDRLEESARGVYCGAILAWEPGERRLVSSIAIRTAVVQDGEARYGAGGAVTLLSDPAEEAEETVTKARPFLTATNSTLAGW